MKKKKILIVDDDPSTRKAIKLSLMDDEHKFYESFAVRKSIEIIQEQELDLALVDVRLGDEYGLDIIRFIKENHFNVPVICISGEASSTEAVEAVKLGAFEFLEKPITPEKLRTTIDNCEKFYSLSRTVSAHKEINEKYQILGSSEPVELLKRQIEQIALTSSKVLITGETGTGKELAACQLHYKSERSKAPFVIVNCSAIPASLIESTFFGHKKGSFTGADSNQIGKLEYADGGTIFLDEIGDLSDEVQNKLLRFLETGEIQKVGSNTNKFVDVRVVAATSKPLVKMVEQGKFRRDLYYRLNVLEIKVPALREICEDVPLLFSHFIKRYSIELNRPELKVSDEFILKLQQYQWPGNIRELRNLAERCVIMKTGTLNKSDFGLLTGSPSPSSATQIKMGPLVPLKEYCSKREREYLVKALGELNGNITRVAEMLGIQRASLHNKIRKYGINIKDI